MPGTSTIVKARWRADWNVNIVTVALLVSAAVLLMHQALQLYLFVWLRASLWGNQAGGSHVDWNWPSACASMVLLIALPAFVAGALDGPPYLIGAGAALLTGAEVTKFATWTGPSGGGVSAEGWFDLAMLLATFWAGAVAFRTRKRVHQNRLGGSAER